jgi:hypothetical protein
MIINYSWVVECEERIETTRLESNKTFLENVLVSRPSYSTNGLLYETN